MTRATGGFDWVRSPGPVTSGLRIGLLGGSFNPAHEGHRHVSLVALKRLGLDYVWWLVSPQNPLKSSKGLASLRDRQAQASAMARHPRIIVSAIEEQFGTRYTVDTLLALMRRFPQVDFVWLMGSDNLDSFHLWRRWPDIVRMVPIAAVTRPGSVLAALRAAPIRRFGRLQVPVDLMHSAPPAIAVIDGPRDPHNSTAIRAAL